MFKEKWCFLVENVFNGGIGMAYQLRIVEIPFQRELYDKMTPSQRKAHAAHYYLNEVDFSSMLCYLFPADKWLGLKEG